MLNVNVLVIFYIYTTQIGDFQNGVVTLWGVVQIFEQTTSFPSYRCIKMFRPIIQFNRQPYPQQSAPKTNTLNVNINIIIYDTAHMHTYSLIA